jgi:hypothetical protein
MRISARILVGFVMLLSLHSALAQRATFWAQNITPNGAAVTWSLQQSPASKPKLHRLEWYDIHLHDHWHNRHHSWERSVADEQPNDVSQRASHF